MKNYGTRIIVSQNANLKIYGSYINKNNASIKNDGNIIVKANWINNASNNVFVYNNTLGYVILNGNTTQIITGETPTKFENLLVNNTIDSAISIENTGQEITNKLILRQGVINTNTNSLTVSNPNYESIVEYSNTSFVNGTLIRYIENNNETYAFPVGKGTDTNSYYLAELINHNLQGVNYIEADFDELLDFDFQNLNVSDLSTMSYDEINTEGVWTLTPDNQISSGSYDLKLYIDNFQNLIDNRFAILSRPNTSTTAADWDCTPCGTGSIGLNNDYGEGRMISDGYALRKGFDHFTQFGIAMASCPTPQLPTDTAIYFGDSAYLYPGNFDSYTWSTGSNDSAIYANQTGEYIVDVTTSIAGCETASDTVNLFVSKIESNVYTQNVSCFGYNDGLIHIIPNGGVPGYHYNWNPVNTDSDSISNLAPMTYAVTITDSIGCYQVIPKIDITEPDSLYLTADILQNVCFNDSAGAINISAYGGIPDYNYYWSNGETSQNINNLKDGIYYLTLTDANNCQNTQQFELKSDATEIIINAETGTGNHYYGYIHTTVTGGTPDYTYNWDYDTGNNTPNADNLYAGIYTITVSDYYGCKKSKAFVIEAKLTIPTVITPNNDGFNDYWDIVNLEAYDDVNIQIFNRWGDKVFDYTGDGRTYREDKSLQWNGIYNGKKLPLGTYVYIIKFSENKNANGTITIVY